MKSRGKSTLSADERVLQAKERTKNKVSLHGVALETKGKGVLITGPSGIGKTTAAMKVVNADTFWIADDLAVIEKSTDGMLVMKGHQKIRKYLHTEQTGIAEVRLFFPPQWIKLRTRLEGIIALVRYDGCDVTCEWSDQNVLEKKVPCLIMNIPRTGYFNGNLLKNAIKRFSEVG